MCFSAGFLISAYLFFSGIETMIEIGIMTEIGTMIGIVVEAVTEIGRGRGTVIAGMIRNMVERGIVIEKVGSVIGEKEIVADAEATQEVGAEVETAEIVMKNDVNDMLVAVLVLEGMKIELMIILEMNQRRRRRRRRRRMMEPTIQIQRLQRQIEFVHPLV